jgi:hypothetical protein
MNRRWVPLLAVCLVGCVIERPGPTQHDFQTVERDSSELVRVNLIMGAGNLRVDSGTDKLAAADFTYNLASWKPEMRYTSAAGRGSLTIRQSESHQPHLGKNEYEWDLRLNREVPLDLTVHFGAGEAHLNVGDLNLRSVDVEMGVGRLALDLDGRPKQSYNVNVSGGVGEATIHLPAGVGVDAEATGGIGSIQASGLRKRGDRYFNDAYADSKVTIHLTVHGGVGSIRLIAD